MASRPMDDTPLSARKTCQRDVQALRRLCAPEARSGHVKGWRGGAEEPHHHPPRQQGLHLLPVKCFRQEDQVYALHLDKPVFHAELYSSCQVRKHGACKAALCVVGPCGARRQKAGGIWL